ncbi:MAG TPA: bifunctional phosphoribosylaminoimidazolecarboxamide formyltransferase/IMP cyclohydrolase [Ilumatobacteraceae bacterium]|nr:bifunctional phosphoribosylaminoimidazolecarboxamide formyltransferase/IMP cyclohydrolase [Ilumatobacteraceae bacterium]
MPTALLSVYDKAGIVEFAEGLHQLGWRIVSSGGTAKAISAAGTPVTDLAELTGVPAILDHRVVTLHPKIHGGLLADPTNEKHRADMAEYGIDAIDLLVCNLYPFATDPSIELIDIGGPAMVRAAAKNHRFVAVVVDPSDYGVVLDELRADGAIGVATKQRLARDAFARIAAYDAQIATWFDDNAPSAGLPDNLHLSLSKVQPLRYGENPHQTGARYRLEGRRSWWDDAVQHGGKEMSYLNLFDTEAAWRLAQRFHEAACVIVKHANPCGVALSDDITDAYITANACDPVSAFGGVVALNRSVPAALADALASVFTEVIIAPSFDDDALAILTEKKNLRVLSGPPPYGVALDIRSIDGGLLVQDVDTINLDPTTWRVVTRKTPTDAQWSDMRFAWQVCAAVSSNAIVYAKDCQAFGIGAGQQNRLDSARIAAERSAGRADGGVCASDAFFPFRDGLDAAAAAGISAVIQPGGSVRDDEVIAAADGHGIAMVFTSERHFRH